MSDDTNDVANFALESDMAQKAYKQGYDAGYRAALEKVRIYTAGRVAAIQAAPAGIQRVMAAEMNGMARGLAEVNLVCERWIDE